MDQGRGGEERGDGELPQTSKSKAAYVDAADPA